MEFLHITPSLLGLWVWLKPGAKNDAIIGFGARGLEISVKARAIKAEANHAMIALLATYLGVPKTTIVLLKGLQSRRKYLEMRYSDAVLDKLNLVSKYV